MDNRIRNLELEIKTLESNIKKGYYEGENLIMAKDMLKTKTDELNKLKGKNVTSVQNAPIKGFKKKTAKTMSQMSGGMKGM